MISPTDRAKINASSAKKIADFIIIANGQDCWNWTVQKTSTSTWTLQKVTTLDQDTMDQVEEILNIRPQDKLDYGNSSQARLIELGLQVGVKLPKLIEAMLALVLEGLTMIHGSSLPSPTDSVCVGSNGEHRHCPSLWNLRGFQAFQRGFEDTQSSAKKAQGIQKESVQIPGKFCGLDHNGSNTAPVSPPKNRSGQKQTISTTSDKLVK
ncbi:hypothetical protein F5887DRAFT_919557 [Amanita rubescens]|nr:hypothetical protein F5887DRAFT_919557 [Amanita rubescens]